MIAKLSSSSVRNLTLFLLIFTIIPSKSPANSIFDADYRCTMTFVSVDYKSGELRFSDEYTGSKLDMFLSESGESTKFVLSVRNGKAYFSDSRRKKHDPIPLGRKGNKLFFQFPTKKVSTSEGNVFMKVKGFFDLKTSKLLQTANSYNRSRSIDIKYAVSGLCVTDGY